MGLRSQLFTSNDIWNSGENSAVFYTAVGGGSGVPSQVNGGAGAGELVINKMISVTPNTDYAVIVGTKGLGKNDPALIPTAPTASTFVGCNALGGGKRQTAFGPDFPGNYGGQNTGSGGGVGGAVGGAGGEGYNPQGRLEARHYTGGSAGQFGLGWPAFPGVHLGPRAVVGAAIPGNTNAGGAGGGVLWGGTNGGNAGDTGVTPVPGVNMDMDADPTHYGAGAGGNGDFDGAPQQGGDGAGGCVILTWSAPN